MQNGLNRWKVMKKLRNRIGNASKDSNQAELRSQYSLSPVSKLPSDVLVTIFLLSTSITDDFCRKFSRPISQVCHFWRIVALECPLLWNYIGGSRCSFEWVTEMIRRSAIAPLDVNTNSLAIFKASLDYASRIRKMAVTVKRGSSFSELDFADSIAAFMQRDAEQLKELSIDFCPANIDNPATVLKVPGDALFAGKAPQLRSVILRGCAFNFASLHLFPKLTKLTVGYLHPSLSPTISEWLSFFRCAPQLESLTIDRAIKDFDTNSVLQTNGPLVNLPQLRILSIESPLTVCCSILSHIAPDYTCNVSVHCSDTWEGPELQTLMRILRPHLALLSENSSSHKLSLTVAEDQVIIENAPLNGRSHLLTEPLLMSFRWREGTLGWQECFPSLLPAFGGYVAGPTVVALSIKVISSFRADIQSVFFPWFIMLNNVKTLEGNIQNFFSLLQMSLPQPPEAPSNHSFPESVLLPSLHTLSIPAFIIELRSLQGYYFYSNYREFILEFIRWRSEKGLPIVKLVLEGYLYPLDEKFIDSEPFKKLGVIVEWRAY